MRRWISVSTAVVLVAGALTGVASAQDPRVGLSPGLTNAGVASDGLSLLAHRDKAPGFSNPSNPGDFGFVNSDLAFGGPGGKYAFSGNFNGFTIWDISDPSNPTLTTAVVCPGGQGDVSVFGNLLFMSVEETRGKIDCTLTPAATATTRFRGVRIFDISNINAPVQLPGVQTCRGSHTHTLVTDPNDPANIYVYVQGTAGVRPAAELAGCSNTAASNPATSLYGVEVIKVPLAAPQTASIVNFARLFANPDTGALNGLQNAPPTPQHPSGIAWSPSPVTDACHDITAFPEIGLAAGACEGNGILIDISDPANPKRLDAVADPNYAYWHSATFSNDGTKVVFTDEWGGGTAARCRVTDQLNWGANTIFDIVGGKMEFRSYYKMPAAQTNQENCVAHNGAILPVPGRDIMTQAWYQGGVSVFDFTDSSNPKEIAFYDRGPISGTSLVLGGQWSTYWYNGHLYGHEIARGIDVFDFTPTDDLSQAEIDYAKQPVHSEFNAQLQSEITWYDFSGFLATFQDAPVLNPTDSRNVQTFWFRLGGDRGLDVLAPGSPASRQIDCQTKAPLGPLEPTATPGYDSFGFQAHTGRYYYPWKPAKNNGYAGTCREFVLTLSNGSSHSAYLQFTK